MYGGEEQFPMQIRVGLSRMRGEYDAQQVFFFVAQEVLQVAAGGSLECVGAVEQGGTIGKGALVGPVARGQEVFAVLTNLDKWDKPT
jgi:hypothetical protein